MNREELTEAIQEIQDRNYRTFKGSNEAELMIREEIADLFQSQLSEAREVPKLPANETLDLMMRVNNAEKKASNHFDNLMEYMRIVEEVIGFAGPFEKVREELLKLKQKPEEGKEPECPECEKQRSLATKMLGPLGYDVKCKKHESGNPETQGADMTQA